MTHPRSGKELLARTAQWLENAVAFTALAVLLLCVLWGVLTRYVTASPAVWTTELSGILFTWVVFIGAMMAFREGRHIRVTLLLDKLPRRAGKFLTVVSDLAVIVFLSYAAVLSVKMMLLGATRLSPVLRIPFSWVYLATVVAFTVMAAIGILRVLGIIAGPEEEGPAEQQP